MSCFEIIIDRSEISAYAFKLKDDNNFLLYDSLEAVMQKRWQTFASTLRTYIETTGVNNQLPNEITELITGNEYWVNAKSNRYRKLIVRDT